MIDKSAHIKPLTDDEFKELNLISGQLLEWVGECPGRCFVGFYFRNFVRLFGAYLYTINKLTSGGKEMGKKFDFFKWLGILTNAAMQMLSKTSDGDLTLLEGLEISETAMRQAVPGVNSGDFQRFNAITSIGELEAFEYQEGDILIVVPVELAGKLKYEFNN